jgi:hypothetical protein
MEPLKDVKNPLGLPRIKADALILHRKSPLLSFALGRDMNPRGHLSVKLERIANEVLEHQPELLGIGLYHR